MRLISARLAFAAVYTSCLATLPVGLEAAQVNKDMDFDQPGPSGPPLLSDIIGINKRCTIMSDYALGLAQVATRLQDSSLLTLVLAPLNSAITSMPVKPWKDTGASGREPEISPMKSEDNAAANIAKFVKAHVVTMEDKSVVHGMSIRNMLGQTLHVEERGGRRYIQPGNHGVVSEKEVANGFIWVIDGVIDPRDTHEGDSASHGDL